MKIVHTEPMLVSIGSRRAAADLVDQLLDCHARIRGMVALAHRIAAPPPAPAAEIAAAAADVARYFTEAYPQHVADEELDLAPRLRGRDPGVDAALAAMHAEHDQHQAAIDRMIAACRAGQVAVIGAAATELEAGMLAHLEHEERVMFPAVREHLDAADGAAVLASMRLRRS